MIIVTMIILIRLSINQGDFASNAHENEATMDSRVFCMSFPLLT